MRTSTLALSLATFIQVCAVGTARAAPAGSPWGAQYFPNIPLVTHEGKPVRFYDDLIKDKRVVISFIYTTCTKQCGLITANLARVERELGDRVGKEIFFYSITLDAGRDTPEVLKRYAQAFKAKPGWTFLTGNQAEIQLLRRKFGDLASIEDHKAHLAIGNDAAGQWWTTSALDNPKYLATVIRDWMDPTWKGNPGQKSYASAPAIVPPSRGQMVFRENCAACHMANGESVGPDLQGVVARRGRDWVKRWLRSPERMVAEKDPVALALVARHEVLMPTPDLKEPALDAVITFMEAADRMAAPAAKVELAAQTEPAPAAVPAVIPALEVKGARRIEIKVDEDGFTPREVKLRKGEPATLVFTRVTESTCITAVDIPDESISNLELPLNQPAAITITPRKAGLEKFHCSAMAMGDGRLVVVDGGVQ